MKVLIIGANSDIAFELIKIWHEQHDLILAARNSNALELRAKEAGVRYTQTLAFDAEKHESLEQLSIACPEPDLVLIAHGILEKNELSALYRMQQINFNSYAYLAKTYAALMAKKNAGIIIALSSVAGIRGRASNYFYGVGKAALNHFLSGLRNEYHSKNVRICTVLPGPVDTKMLKGHDIKTGLISSPQKVAKDIDSLLRNKKDILYSPWYWKWIMWVISSIPEFIFKRMKL